MRKEFIDHRVFVNAALAMAGFRGGLTDFIDNELLKNQNIMGKQKYLKRLAPTFAGFKKKHDKQKKRAEKLKLARGKLCKDNFQSSVNF
jgi:hypothetical protein